MLDVNLILPKASSGPLEKGISKKDCTTNSTDKKSDFLSKVKEYEEVKDQKTEALSVNKQTNNKQTKKIAQAKSIINNNDFEVSKTNTEDNSTQEIIGQLMQQQMILPEVEQQIISVIMESLNVSSEKITAVLNELGMEPIELLNRDNLITFFNTLYEKTSENELLFDTEGVKDIADLVQKLDKISELIQIDGKQVVVNKTIVNDTVVASDTTITGETQPVVQEVLQEGVIHESHSAGSNVKLSEESNFEVVDEVGSDISANAKVLQLGIDLPVYSFKNIETGIWDTYQNQSVMTKSFSENSIPQQLISKIEISTLKSHQEITMELMPKELGKLSFKIAENSGVVTATIRVDNDKAKELVMQSLGELKSSLESQGLSIGSFSVEVRKDSHHYEMEKQRQKSSKRINELINKLMVEDESNQIEERIQETEVDYIV